MSKSRTYQDYKLFFEEVSKANKLEFYQYSFTLLYSFLEDRINKIYSDEYQLSNGMPPRPYHMKQSLYMKLVELKKDMNFVYSPSIVKTLDMVNRRRNEIIHEALFNINSITKDDITFLTKFCRHIDKIRMSQKKRMGQHERKGLRLRFSKPLPPLSSFKSMTKPSPYSKMKFKPY